MESNPQVNDVMILRELIKDIKWRHKSIGKNEYLKAGKRLVRDNDLHMLHVVTLVTARWDNIEEYTIVPCWLKSQMFSTATHNDLKVRFKK